ncbi:hypothetical protein GNI_061150 [Gregarina niphandrodes]|uniref:Uncharacterized protein n=1 Tax=Gregarina niphandrodes TaxID=110365 RepID=A0A023B8F7_GRENI|nr:hypothetical protein GNI_061150 [Gregarina niphandrodes]EZG68847.1 hypothetical protein GNI_061150 [Gregarina niphandrodes]|eukprot:XP_011134541.1 hypothetical protein GNI_061150 [Gregarina niphandrodes]
MDALPDAEMARPGQTYSESPDVLEPLAKMMLSSEFIETCVLGTITKFLWTLNVVAREQPVSCGLSTQQQEYVRRWVDEYGDLASVQNIIPMRLVKPLPDSLESLAKTYDKIFVARDAETGDEVSFPFP